MIHELDRIVLTKDVEEIGLETVTSARSSWCTMAGVDTESSPLPSFL
jgi:hypothetical protein